MNRRDLVLSLLAIGSAPLAGLAQDIKKVSRIGFLSSSSAARDKPYLAAFLARLGEFGYAEGRNIHVEQRYADGKFQNLPAIVAGLLARNLDVLVVAGAPAAHAAKSATSTVPIVMTNAADPVGTGLVASLARPGGNITGLSDFNAGLTAKLFELLRETVPAAMRVAVLSNPSNPANPPQLKRLQDIAHGAGVAIVSYEVTSTAEIERAFTAMTPANTRALIVLGDPMLSADPGKIAAYARKSRLPAIFTSGRAVEAGGLLSYGTNFEDLYRGAAVYVDKILKGAKPADLPVEQPTKLELVINLATAKALGLKIPQSILLRADRVIE
jgi:putative ABC transport system substrate-binding protein